MQVWFLKRPFWGALYSSPWLHSRSRQEGLPNLDDVGTRAERLANPISSRLVSLVALPDLYI